MASWNAYIEKLKNADCGCPVEQALICGIEDKSVWASTEGFSVSADEITKLCGPRENFCVSGLYIGGTKCRLLRDDWDTEGVHCLHLKTSADADGNAYNVCVGKTAKAFIIAKGTKEANGGQISDKVFNVVHHLRKANM